MTPEEFATQMQEIKDTFGADEESAHSRMDQLLLIALRELGYGKGCDIFDSQPMWYA